MYNEMLWIFTQLPDDYIVLDTETTGLPDESGLPDHVARYRLVMPEIQGVFCSQKAAILWAQAMDLPCSHRGQSLKALMKVLGVDNLREKSSGIHGAAIDGRQAAQVTEVMRHNGNMD